jgi:hypothetical protein
MIEHEKKEIEDHLYVLLLSRHNTFRACGISIEIKQHVNHLSS